MKIQHLLYVLTSILLLISCENDTVTDDIIKENEPPEEEVGIDNFSISQYGITWIFEEEPQHGQFVNGDHWVLGPVKIIGITNDLHAEGFTPSEHQDGSMVNPGTDNRQGYDGTLDSYDPSLNVNFNNNGKISINNPLTLNTNESLVSTVSWLYNSETDREPGCPNFNAGTNTPRPVLRSAAILTCLSETPPEGSFRPPYCGNDKTTQSTRTTNNLQTQLLSNLSPANIADIPNISEMERTFQRVWLDHVNESFGSYLHPSENMPDYGREMAKGIGDLALLLQLDFSNLPGSPSKDVLLHQFIQLGIDFAGIADNGGSWPPNGGFQMGRKFPILFAGMLLGDQHMMEVGNWTTLFQEDAQTFYVTQTEIDITNSSAWNPDTRITNPLPYSELELGLPEWGIRHATQPTRDALNWDAPYRHINGVANSGFVLATHIMGLTEAWNHPALFDYMDRWWELTDGAADAQQTTLFTKNMWQAYRADYPPVWKQQ